MPDFVCLQKYEHETEEKADCGVPEVSKRLNVNQALVHKWNKVVILLNDTNVVVILLCFVETFVREGYKNFGLDMA